MKRVCESVW